MALFQRSLLCQGQAVGADKGVQVGGNLGGDFLEFFAGGIAGDFETFCGSVRSNGNNRSVARVRSRGAGQFVEPLLRVFQVVDADIKNQVPTHRLATHEQTTRAILLIGFGEDATDAYPLLRKRRAARKTAGVKASLRQRANYILRDRLHQRVGLIGGGVFV